MSEAEKCGIDPNDSENPFITMNLVPQTGDEKDEPVPYIAVSFHISSKDTPNWFWSTFEHVSNQDRCNWIGCNDSFGFETTQTITIDSSVAAAFIRWCGTTFHPISSPPFSTPSTSARAAR